MTRLRACEGGAAADRYVDPGDVEPGGVEPFDDELGDVDGSDDARMGAGSYRIADDGRKVLRIDCADCAHRQSPVCTDCLVTFLCARESDGAVVVPISEIRAVRLLQGAGLAPRIRHRSARLA